MNLAASIDGAGYCPKLNTDYTNPDAMIGLETIGPRAGLSHWTREELERYLFLHLE